MNKIVIAFDVDRILNISNGPIDIENMKLLKDAGYIVGICGDWSLFVRLVDNWNDYVSFIGQWQQAGQTKTEFLKEFKQYIKADCYVLIGHDPTHYDYSYDIKAVKEAGWGFIRKDHFNIHLLGMGVQKLESQTGKIFKIENV